MDWDKTRVLDRATRLIQLKVEDTLHIKRTPTNSRLNWDGPGLRVTRLLDHDHEEASGKCDLVINFSLQLNSTALSKARITEWHHNKQKYLYLVEFLHSLILPCAPFLMALLL